MINGHSADVGDKRSGSEGTSLERTVVADGRRRKNSRFSALEAAKNLAVFAGL